MYHKQFLLTFINVLFSCRFKVSLTFSLMGFRFLSEVLFRISSAILLAAVLCVTKGNSFPYLQSSNIIPAMFKLCALCYASADCEEGILLI